MLARMGFQDGLRSLAIYQTLADGARRDLAKDLAHALGDDYRPATALRGAARLAAVVHVPSDTELVAIPGGTYVMGFRPEEDALMRTLEYVEGDDALEVYDALAASDPPRVATVAPFLCARAPLLRDAAWQLLGEEEGWVVGDEDSPLAAIRFEKDAAEALVAKLPFRLMTDAEWEYVAREGGGLAFINGATPEATEAACEALYNAAYAPERVDAGTNGLGIWGLPWGDWLATAKAPRTPAYARGGAAMAYPWQSDEIALQLCAWSNDGCGNDENGVRFALDLPGAAGKRAAKAAPKPKAGPTPTAGPAGVAMMAIVSKAIFEKEAPGAAVGGVYRTDRYRSGNKALAALAGGGSLYLVTVRPPDERLWLVAVLAGLDATDDAWVAAAANATPIADISALRPRLRFTTGKGMSQDDGALGMSLQTPRQLTPDDVALLAAVIARR